MRVCTAELDECVSISWLDKIMCEYRRSKITFSADSFPQWFAGQTRAEWEAGLAKLHVPQRSKRSFFRNRSLYAAEKFSGTMRQMLDSFFAGVFTASLKHTLSIPFIPGKDPTKKSLRVTGPLLSKLSQFIRKKIARQKKINSNRAAAQQLKAREAAAAAAAATPSVSAVATNFFCIGRKSPRPTADVPNIHFLFVFCLLLSFSFFCIV